MLVLTRKINEEILIGDNLIVCIVEIRGGKVRLGISAPTDMPVHRREVYESIQREKLALKPIDLAQRVKELKQNKERENQLCQNQ